jgi:hypothetical protein
MATAKINSAINKPKHALTNPQPKPPPPPHHTPRAPSPVACGVRGIDCRFAVLPSCWPSSFALCLCPKGERHSFNSLPMPAAVVGGGSFLSQCVPKRLQVPNAPLRTSWPVEITCLALALALLLQRSAFCFACLFFVSTCICYWLPPLANGATFAKQRVLRTPRYCGATLTTFVVNPPPSTCALSRER